MTKLRCGIALLVATSLTACAPNVLRSARSTVAVTGADSRETSGVVVMPGTCANPTRSENGGAAGALVAPIIGMAVDFGVNAISAALKRQQEGRNAAWFASTVMPFSVDPAGGKRQASGAVCLRIFRGELVNSKPLEFLDHPIFDSYIDLTWRAGEGEAKDQLTLEATPFRVDYADTSAAVRGKKQKDISIVLGFSTQTLQAAATPAEKPKTETAKAVIRLDLGRLQIGKRYPLGLLGTVRAASTLGAADATTLTAVVVESEGANPALDAFVSAWDSNKGDLAKALKDALKGAVD